MTKIQHQFCYVCNEEFSYLDRGGKPQIYCGNSCKQKAYRMRKAQERKAQESMLTFEAYTLQERIITSSTIDLEPVLGSFFHKHGKAVYEDLLLVINLAITTQGAQQS